jgi:hypothetical protein
MPISSPPNTRIRADRVRMPDEIGLDWLVDLESRISTAAARS